MSGGNERQRAYGDECVQWPAVSTFSALRTPLSLKRALHGGMGVGAMKQPRRYNVEDITEAVLEWLDPHVF